MSGASEASGAAPSVPLSQVENGQPRPRAGLVAPAAGQGQVEIKRLLQALRLDAMAAAGGLAADWQPQVVEEVVWATGALGCAEPAGIASTQALEPGWRVVLSSARGLRTYHASRRGAWRECSASEVPQGPVTR